MPVRARVAIEHVVCDNPICTHAHPDPQVGHIWPSTQSENLHRMQAKGRGQRGQRWWLRRWSGLGRAERAERSRQLAAAVRHGWDAAAVRTVLLRIAPAPTRTRIRWTAPHRAAPGLPLAGGVTMAPDAHLTVLRGDYRSDYRFGRVRVRTGRLA